MASRSKRSDRQQTTSNRFSALQLLPERRAKRTRQLTLEATSTPTVDDGSILDAVFIQTPIPPVPPVVENDELEIVVGDSDSLFPPKSTDIDSDAAITTSEEITPLRHEEPTLSEAPSAAVASSSPASSAGETNLGTQVDLEIISTRTPLPVAEEARTPATRVTAAPGPSRITKAELALKVFEEKTLKGQIRWICFCGKALAASTMNGRTQASNLIRHIHIHCSLLKKHWLKLDDERVSWDERVSIFLAAVEREKMKRRSAPTIPSMAKIRERGEERVDSLSELHLTPDEFHIWFLVVHVLKNGSFRTISDVHLKSLWMMIPTFDLKGPSVALYSWETYRSTIFPRALEFSRFVLRQQLAYLTCVPDGIQMPFVAMATDGWSSRGDRKAIAVTGASINWSAKKLQINLLGIVPLSEAHTSGRLSETYRSLFDQIFNRKQPQIGSVTTDNAANESLAGWSIGAQSRLPCMSHTIQLWLKGFFYNDDHIQLIIWWPLKYVTRLAEYSSVYRKFKQFSSVISGKPGRPPHRVKTRWWSDVPLLDYYLKNQTAIELFIDPPKSPDQKWLSALAIRSTKQLCAHPDLLTVKNFLSEVKAIADGLEADDLTSHLVLPSLLRLHALCENLQLPGKERILFGLRTYFRRALIHDSATSCIPTLFSCATALNPAAIREKLHEKLGKLFLPSFKFDQTSFLQVCVEANIATIQSFQPARESQTTASKSSEGNAAPAQRMNLSGAQEKSAREIMEQFIKLASTQTFACESLLDFWDETLRESWPPESQTFLAFQRLIELLLTAFASQVSVERTFSRAGRVQSDPRRGRMKDATLCDEVFIQSIFNLHGATQPSAHARHLLLLREFCGRPNPSFSALHQAEQGIDPVTPVSAESAASSSSTVITLDELDS
jgi:DNA-nicking Smr family endonuclease